MIKDPTEAKRPVIIQVTGYYPPHLGGAERVAEALSDHMARRGYDVRVLTSAVNGRPGRENVGANLQIHRFKTWEFAHTPWMPGFIPAIWRVPRRHSVIHLHLGQAMYPEMTWLAAKLRRIPYIVHFHLDLQPSGSLGKLFLIYKALVLRVVIKQADRLVVFSSEQQNYVHETYGIPKARIRIIPNGVGAEYFLPARRYQTPVRRLLNVGRLSPQKRLHLLVEAMSKLPDDYELTFVGDGEQRAELEHQVRQLGLKRVTFAGAKLPKDTLPYFRRAEVFVIPSEIEGMPLVVLEAMASGLPVVAANVSGLTELVTGVGILVDEASGQAFARALKKLLADPKKLQKLSEQSVVAAHRYSWEQLADSFEALYKELAA